MRIQLVTFTGCPNASAARQTLSRALAAAGVVAMIEEVDTSDPGTPEALRGWGSPTVLIDGRDIEGREAPTGPGCRLYMNDRGVALGVIPEPLIVAALRQALARTQDSA